MFYELVSQLSDSTLYQSLPAFGVELVLCATIVLMLLCRIFSVTEKIDASYIAFIGVIVALMVLSPMKPWDVSQALESTEAVSPVQVPLGELPSQEIFTGMLVYDGFAVMIKTILLVFLILFFALVKITKITRAEENTDFFTLVLGATLGMCVMASANHMLTIFMGIEMASVPSYVMVAFMRGKKESSEAALKYAIFGAGAAGVMLYGISLLSGMLNSAHIPTMAANLAELMSHDPSQSELFVLGLGAMMLMVGLAFKLSAVPFHFWCPDVFAGATAEVNAFLSIASKAAALALLVRVAIGFSILPEQTTVALADPTAVIEVAAVEAEINPNAFFLASGQDPKAHVTEDAHESDEPTAEASTDPLSKVRYFMAMLIGFIAMITCTFGNLAAYGQTNIKRLLAYSTIAHAGYMMMAVPAMIALSAESPELAQTAVGGLAIYIAIYVFMNLGAFAVVAFVRDTSGSEEISDYSGMISRSKIIAVCFTLILVSLVGLPPLAGFIGKFAIFASLAQGYSETGQLYLLVLLIVGGVNSAISLYYYLRIVKVMTIDPEADDTASMQRPLGMLQNSYLVFVTVPVALLIVNWEFLNTWVTGALAHLIS
ncbi:MAG: NADH-quinone oxidoreductase subunit N [Pirellulales bacterium]